MVTEKKNNQGQQSQSTIFSNNVPHIGHYDLIPEYQKDNGHITHGYRINFDNPKKIIKSLFMFHNESVNIWTHLLAAFLIAGALLLLIWSNAQSFSSQIVPYKTKVSQSFEKYIYTLQNITNIFETDNLKIASQEKFNQFKTSILQNYDKLAIQISQCTTNMTSFIQEKYIGIKQEMLKTISKNFLQFQKYKRQFQKVFLPFLLNQMNDRLNSTYLLQLKIKMQQIKYKIDGQTSLIHFIDNQSPNPQKISKWPIILFLVSAFICLMCSALFHLFIPMSQRTFIIFSRFDYAGISILIAGSGFPVFYYSMYCQFEVVIMYLTFTTIGAITVFILSLCQWFHKPQHTVFRGLTYSLYGLHYLFPIGHLLIDIFFFDKYGDPFNFITSFPYIILLGASYLGGCRIYVDKCPERKYPGKFNTCGHSHQIWHCFVVLGIIFTYFAAVNSFEMRKISLCPASQ